jgi:hypothetical protein
MISKRWFFLLVFFCSCFSLSAQKIVYSDYDREDSRKLEFDIAGKVGGNFLVYKNTRNRVWITVFDNEMQQIAKVEQEYVPNNDHLINTDFFPYSDFCYMIYQYQRKNVVYCMAARIDGNGKKIGDEIELDTAHIGFSANNKIYTAISSEDKSHLIVFKINSRNRKLYQLTTLLYNDKLALLKTSRIGITMEERNDNLGDFTLDNDGNLVCCKFFRGNNDNITKAAIMIKGALSDNFVVKEMEIEKTPLDEIHIKADNFNNRYFITSFYSSERRGSIEGFYFFIWGKDAGKPVLEKTVPLGEDIRKEARGDASIKMAFDDYFIRQVITRKDGGFIIGSEAFYTTSRFNSWSRWDYLYGSPAYGSPFNNSYYSPYYNNAYWNSRYSNNQAVRYHADNITMFSFNDKGELEWNNVIGKSQYNDETDDIISYQLMNTGDQLHFLMNMQERRNNLLTDFSVVADGGINRNPTLKNLDKGYDFMPKFGKQVSAKQMIVPCLYRNYICFAKIDYTQN